MSGTTQAIIDVLVPETADGWRLDRALAAAVPDLSRSRLQALIREGAVTLAGAVVADPGRKAHTGETFTLNLPDPIAAEPTPETIPLTIVHEDHAVVVLDKPAGLVVHPAAGHSSGTLVNALLAHCGDSLSGIGGVRRPGIVHRLDKDTTGLMVVAKSDAAHQGLAAQFEAHGSDGRLERSYLALVWGHLLRRQGAVDAPLARSRTQRTRIAVTRGEDGRHAVTHYEVLETYSDNAGRPLASLLRLRLETGRTHQIRVHMAHLGHPVMGDPVYATGFNSSASRLAPAAAAALSALGRQALHAAGLGFEHPVSGEALSFESPLPPDMAALVAALRAAEKPRSRRRASPSALKKPR